MAAEHRDDTCETHPNGALPGRANSPGTLAVLGLAAVSLVFAVALGSCGDDSADPECAISSDCPTGNVCDRGRCVPPGTGDAGNNGPIDGGNNGPACTGGVVPAPGDLILNEILAAVPTEDSGFGDVNGDGVRDSADDEFLEFYNATDGTLIIEGINIYKGDADEPTVTLATPCLEAGQALVVFGGLEEGASLPSYPETVVEIADSNFSLTNSGTTLRVAGADGVDLVPNFEYLGTSGQSITLNPQLDPDAEYVEHTVVGTSVYSPGTCPDGKALATGCPTEGPDCPDSDPPSASNLIVNEILSNVINDEVLGDVNMDGTRDASDDEFVEIVNIGDNPVAVGGLTIYKGDSARATVQVACLQPAQGLVIFGGLEDGASIPSFGSTIVEIASTSFGWTNGGGSIFRLEDSEGTELFNFEVPSSGAESLTRSTQLTPGSDLVAHTMLNPAEIYSPGTCPDGSAFADGCPEVMQEANDDTSNDAGMDVEEDTPMDVPPDECEGAVAATGENLVLNEILTDPAADAPGDANQDGVRDAAEDEFVEIWNASGSLLDVEGIEIRVNDSERYTFSGCIPADTGVVVFGGLDDGGTPPSWPGVEVIISDTRFQFSNSGGTVSLVAPGNDELVSYDFPSGGDTSFVREPELSNSSGFVEHNAVTDTNLFSPGECRDGGSLTTGCQ